MVAALVLALAAGARGSARDDTVVRVVVSGPRGHTAAVPHPRTDARQAPLESVAPLIPSPLPPPTSSCPHAFGDSVTLGLADGRRVTYGPRCLPKSIVWLQEAIEAEVNEWSPSPPGGTVVAGGRPAERTELRRLLRQVQPTPIARIAIEPLPRAFAKRRSGVAWTVDGRTARAGFEANLLAQLYDRSAPRLGLRPVSAVTLGGETEGLRVVGVNPVRRSLEPAEAVVEDAGGHVVGVWRPGGAAELTLRFDDPARFLKDDGQRFLDALHGPGPFTASVFFEVEDAAGTVVYAAGWLPREGWLFARPDLDSCGPVVHSRPFGASYPPCPA